MRHLNFPPKFSATIFRKNFPPKFSVGIFRLNFPQELGIRHDFHETQEFYAFADILSGRLYFMTLLDFVAANICVYFQYLFMHLCMRQYFWRNCFDLRFKIDIVVMII